MLKNCAKEKTTSPVKSFPNKTKATTVTYKDNRSVYTIKATENPRTYEVINNKSISALKKFKII